MFPLSQSMWPLTACSLLLLLFSSSTPFFPSSEAGSIGVNYGRVANNLPPPANVVQLLKSQGIDQVKLYDADPTVLRALAGTGIRVVVALPNEQLAAAATRQGFALAWVQRNVAAYHPATQIQAIAVGNEVFVDPRNLTASLVPAMQNVHTALARLRLDADVKVSSPIALTALQNSYPSSAGSFRSNLAEPVMKPMLELLRQTGSYLMVNAYPFFAYEANTDVISLDYALFRPNPGVLDSGSGLKYYSLLDAQIDAVFAAMSALKYDDVKVVISETGWPSKGDTKETGAGAANAAAYNGNLVRRVLSGNAGTPRRPQADLVVYLFALFNENQKPGPTSERNYGLFYPDEGKVYDIEFTLSGGGGSSNGGAGLRWREYRGRASGGDSSPSPSSSSSSSSSTGSGRVSASSTGEKWCVANAMVARERLQAALDYACGEGGADCRSIQPGAGCYEPNTLEAHASYAFNSYFQKKGRGVGTCDFEGAAYVVSQPPNVGKCTLPAGP
ncbi:glucan endo-1,3-beta-glucosidase 10-like [Phoenix dactylifera]|uniref:glucan endo-1,3-beta-D-glucosidase n=1 Tax=Phoenix dactylifera TaxID=42345 RepID=A0A8B7BZY0_PHODC|nr:glucan endo-1,3-beta-glucosidase 10-like [Phoenix dactylifera]